MSDAPAARPGADDYVHEHKIKTPAYRKARERLQGHWTAWCDGLGLDPLTAGPADAAVWLHHLAREQGRPLRPGPARSAVLAVDALPGRHAVPIRDADEIEDAIAAAARTRPVPPYRPVPVLTAALARLVLALPPPAPHPAVTAARAAVRTAARDRTGTGPALNALRRAGRIDETTRQGARDRLRAHADHGDPRLWADPAAMPKAELDGALLRLDLPANDHDLALAVHALAWQTARRPHQVAGLPDDGLHATSRRLFVRGLGPDIDAVAAIDPALCAVRAHRRYRRRLAGLPPSQWAHPTIDGNGQAAGPQSPSWWQLRLKDLGRRAGAPGLTSTGLLLGYVAEADRQHATTGQIAAALQVGPETAHRRIAEMRAAGHGRQDHP